LLLVSWFLFFQGLARRDLWSSHEARAAQDAQSMLSDDRWGIPHLFDRKLELQKPPLYYWLVAAVAWLRGGTVDAWAVRLPAAVSGALGVLLLYGFYAVRQRPIAGFAAGVGLATMMHYTWLGRVGRIDMPLTLVVSIQLMGLYLFQKTSRKSPVDSASMRAWLWLVPVYLAAAIAILLKGPIGVVLPGVTAIIYLWHENELAFSLRPTAWLGLVGRYGLWWGLPLVVVITAPWFIWTNLQTHGELFRVFFLKHNLERGLGGGGLASHPWWFYVPRLMLDALPWCVVLPLTFLTATGRRWLRGDAEARFGLTWLLTMLLVLSCSRFKRSDYLLPAYPGLALFLGGIAEHWYRETIRPRALLASSAAILAAVLFGWWLYLGWILPSQETRLELASFASEIRRRAPAPQLVLFFRTEAHDLAFHVGQPLDTILEWENLDIWASRPGVYYVVMPPDVAKEWPQHLEPGRLVEVLRNTTQAGGHHAHPLVLLRTHPELQPSVP
jgi:4-amino-4-deoxy-L-arabinose transferase-like glycosyltransferase